MVSSLYQGVSKQTTLHCKMLSMSKVGYSIKKREFYPHHIILCKLSQAVLVSLYQHASTVSRIILIFVLLNFWVYQAYHLLSPCIKIVSTSIKCFLVNRPSSEANPCTSHESWYLGIPVSPCIHCIKTILNFNICDTELSGVSSVSPIITMYQDCINEYQMFSRKPTKF